MTDSPSLPWLALRQSTGLTQREVERRLGWARDGAGHGRLSLIERGVQPTEDEDKALREFYAAALIGETR